MENITNEIKAKVFAQYWPCNYNNGLDDKTRELFLSGLETLAWATVATPKLILKPLSAISDEDAIEVAKICKVSDSDFYTDQFRDYRGEDKEGNGILGYHLVGKSYIKYLFKKGPRVWHGNPNVFIQASQFLQSRGYDLPQFLLNGKTLHEAGLAIYE